MAIVLMVDDHPEQVEDLKQAIKDKGHGVVFCTCSRDAQEKIRTGGIDCAIYDGCLPRYSDGLDVSAEYGGTFLARETRRFLPGINCLVYTHGLANDRMKELENMGVQVATKGESKIEDILRELRL